MSRRMRAAVLTGHGGFERLEYRGDVAVRACAPDEVLIRVGAAGVNNTDINLREGWYSVDPSTEQSGWNGEAVAFPLIQGADACGEIVAVGALVDADRIGQRVIVDPILRGRNGRSVYLGSDCDGAFAEFVTVPACNAHPVASSLSDVELASFPCSYTAAENMLTRAAIGRRDVVLVTGASGGVGSAAVQLAARRGATVIAQAGAAKASAVAALGASQVLAREADVAAILGRDAVDAVIDVVGGAQFAQLLTVLRPHGRYAVAGAIGGAQVPLDLRTLYLKDLQLLGCTVAPPEIFAALVGYIDRGEIRPVVARTYPLESIVLAQQAFLVKQHTGKIVLIP